MKRVVTIMAAIAAVAVTGCNIGGDNPLPDSYESPVLVSINAETANGNLFTEYLYDEYGNATGLTQSLAGAPVFEEGDYTFGSDGNSRTAIRTYADPEKPDERRIMTYVAFYDESGYNRIVFDKDGKVFLLDENDNPTSDVPAEEWTREFDNSGNLTRYEYKENGTTTVLQRGFRYDIQNKYITFELVEGGAAAVKMYQQYTDDGYEMYENYVSSSNKGTLVEKKTDHTLSSDRLVETYTMTVYNDEGVATTTYYTITFETRKFKVLR